MALAERIAQGRQWLKALGWGELAAIESDQRRRVAAPPLEQPVDPLNPVVSLPSSTALAECLPPAAGQLLALVNHRESRRKYTADDLTQEELAFLLWCTQGVRQVAASGKACLRTVPSGGARHCFETYLSVQRVAGLKPGLYRYLALAHRLAYLDGSDQLQERISAACLNQRMAGQSAVLITWTSVPYRAEWRYGGLAHKMIAIDAGHVCQNLYLACEALSLGCCAVGAYDQARIDELLGVDGVDEFAIFAATVGRV